MKTSDIQVTPLYPERWGNDLDVVNAARVSFNSESNWEDEDEGYTFLSDKDTKLIKYLAKHNHWSPFSHSYLKFRVKAPIFVARQLQKHTVGLAWNEVSRRYVDYEPEFYIPETWRGRPLNVKQGSSEPIDNQETKTNELIFLSKTSLKSYDYLLRHGVAPEQARMALPQNTMTEWIWSGSLYAFMRVCSLRCKPDSQYETQLVANEILAQLKISFPVSTEAMLGELYESK